MSRKTNLVTFLLLAVMCLPLIGFTQSVSEKALKDIEFPRRMYDNIDKRLGDLKQTLNRRTIIFLTKLRRQEEKLQHKVALKDSALSAQLFGDLDKDYRELQELPTGSSDLVYDGYLDSLSTALQFLKSKALQEDVPIEKINQNLGQLEKLRGELNYTDYIQKTIQDRKAKLVEQLEKLGMMKELKKYQKQVYYYQAALLEYKEMIADPAKLEANLLQVLREVPEFKSFFARSSELGQLFALPGAPENSDLMSGFAQGLQTRASVATEIQSRFGNGADVRQIIQDNMQQAQAQMNDWKGKLEQYANGAAGNGANSDVVVPEFKPNGQRSKSFLHRLEFGYNLQSQKANWYFPATTDVGLSVGYKLNDKSVVGIGGSYKVGWGKSWNHIDVSHQGVGLRSYLDWKLKGSFYVSGGYELNYRSIFDSMEQLKNYSAWQKSGLIGISKHIKLKGNARCETKVLWDFLSYFQQPKAQPIIWRIEYKLK